MVVDILRIILCAEMVKELRVGTNPKKRKKNGKIGEKISGTKKNLWWGGLLKKIMLR